MSFDAEQHVRYRIANVPVNRFPFAHFYVQDVFPPEFYDEILAKLPPLEAYTPIEETGTVGEGAYKQRFICKLEDIADDEDDADGPWSRIRAWLMDPAFAKFIVGKFYPAIEERFGKGAQLSLSTDCRLVRDFTSYMIPPHTDTETKLVSLLFYLPADASMRHLGTSIYTATDPSFRSDGSKHLSAKGFKHVARADYLPNSLLAFVRTDFSFHGVEPIADADVKRDLMLYNIYVPRVTVPAAKPQADA